MHHMTRLKMMRNLAKAKAAGYYVPPPPTAEQQAKIAQMVNAYLDSRNKPGQRLLT